jgi:hypothetical protein
MQLFRASSLFPLSLPRYNALRCNVISDAPRPSATRQRHLAQKDAERPKNHYDEERRNEGNNSKKNSMP